MRQLACVLFHSLLFIASQESYHDTVAYQVALEVHLWSVPYGSVMLRRHATSFDLGYGRVITP